MDLPQQPLRCPKCHALVVDRRSALCTTCHAELPKEWILTAQQVGKLAALDAQARAEHAEEMNRLSPNTNPNAPSLVRFLNSNAPYYF